MKKLILSLIILPILAFANEIKEISDKEIESKFLTIVKDVEVEKMLGGTAEFNKCRKDNEFKPGDSDKETKIQLATDCFKKNLTGKNEAALKKLSDDLKLESYGLIKSKNVNDITEYLSQKMRKSLTGVDPKDAASQKWENKKIVDQKVFIDLYTNQLMKSALFEVSRFCFENFRKDSAPATSNDFNSHWSGLDSKSIPTLAVITDIGEPKFIENFDGVDMSKSENISKKLFEGLTKDSKIDQSLYSAFFGYCQKGLTILCDNFKETATKASGTTPTKGAAACLTISKLQSIRTAMKKTEIVAKQFDEMGEDKGSFAIQMIKNPQFYQRGKGANEESLDELTSFSSTEMLSEEKSKEILDIEEKCKDPAKGGQDCENFLVESDSLDNAVSNIELQMNLKREIEVARINEIKEKPVDLKKYLSDNGMFDLLEKLEKDPSYKDKLHDEISKIYDARKIAEIESLKLKVGRRQVNEAEMKTIDKDNRIQENIKETKEERARLAQVVMFNNIITSQLELTDQKTGKSVGRNTNAWNKEMAGLKESKSYDETLFAGIQGEADANGSTLEDTSVVGGGIIDAILGKKDDP